MITPLNHCDARARVPFRGWRGGTENEVANAEPEAKGDGQQNNGNDRQHRGPGWRQQNALLPCGGGTWGRDRGGVHGLYVKGELVAGFRLGGCASRSAKRCRAGSDAANGRGRSGRDDRLEEIAEIAPLEQRRRAAIVSRSMLTLFVDLSSLRARHGDLRGAGRTAHSGPHFFSRNTQQLVAVPAAKPNWHGCLRQSTTP